MASLSVHEAACRGGVNAGQDEISRQLRLLEVLSILPTLAMTGSSRTAIYSNSPYE
ncbi:hypothetical protein BGX23_004236, partial [Mortierella sp. AD031]